MKILILGATGQLGRALLCDLEDIGEIVCPSKKEFDFRRLNESRSYIEKLNPHIIINAAAYTLVDQAEREASLAYQVNGLGPKMLAEAASKLDIPIIHFSTNYVFDGQKKEPYHEEDIPSPINIYGRSKLEGENWIRKIHQKHIILRTSWLFSLYGGKNFLKSMYNLLKTKSVLSVINDQIGSPTSSALVSQVTKKIVKKLEDKSKNYFGTYHLTSLGVTDWHTYTLKILDCMQLKGIKTALNSNDIKPISSLNYPMEALRPINSSLNTEKIQYIFDLKLPFWEQAVENFF